MEQKYISMNNKIKNKLFERVLKDKCPICDKSLEDETEIVEYEKSKLKIHKRHIKYRREK